MIKSKQVESLIVFMSFASSIGVGRFVLTPILPAMKASLNLSYLQITSMIALNFFGYFIGALLLLKKPLLVNKNTLILSMLMVSMTLLFIPFYESVIWFSFIRFLAGFFSSLAFICLAARVIELAKENQWYGAAFGGVGFGIVVSGLIPILIKNKLEWNWMWSVSSFFSFLSLIPVFFINKLDKTYCFIDFYGRKSKSKETLLILSYFLEGAGYIIIGTYMVSLVSNNFGTSVANLNWVVAGIVTIPSIFIWSILLRKNKVINMLSLAYLIQLLAPLIFFFSKNIYSCYLASSFFGITFMGVTHLSMQAASAINMENASSKMTLSYSAGQIFGPLVVLPLIKQTYDNAFLMSAFFISICIYICWYLKKNAE